MENLYLKLLQEFETTGLSSKKSISKFIERNFKKPTSEIIETWYKENENAMAFLRDAENTGHLDFEEDNMFGIGYNNVTEAFRWFDRVDIFARLTVDGLEFLENHKTNTRIVANSNLQTIAIALTVILTAMTFALTLSNSISNEQISKLETHIQVQTQQLHTLQIQLSQASNELLRQKEAKKISPKKS